jgi:hypothetical protein
MSVFQREDSEVLPEIQVVMVATHSLITATFGRVVVKLAQTLSVAKVANLLLATLDLRAVMVVETAPNQRAVAVVEVEQAQRVRVVMVLNPQAQRVLAVVQPVRAREDMRAVMAVMLPLMVTMVVVAVAVVQLQLARIKPSNIV